jgi:hypothetical protein
LQQHIRQLLYPLLLQNPASSLRIVLQDAHNLSHAIIMMPMRSSPLQAAYHDVPDDK